MKVEKPKEQIDFSKIEKDVLTKWERENTFLKSVESRPRNKRFNFYDGPPFATGLPHFGHFVPSSIKDSVARYYTMKGYRVERRFGWDCHGVPVEMLVQKELGLNGRKDIESFGISKFNDACRKTVLRYTKEWRHYIQKLGRWVDMDNEYRTMDIDYMESVWAVFKMLWEKELIYESKVILSYSPALGTTLSNFEASLDYRDIQDPSLTVAFSLKGSHSGKSLLVWTTTPWTLPANTAISVDPKGLYCEVFDKKTGRLYYLLKVRLEDYWQDKESYEIKREFLGKELHKISYEPLFQDYVNHSKENDFKIYGADYVDHETVTGAVHTAPAFGEDDFNLARKYDLSLVDHLDENGLYLKKNISALVGLNFIEGNKIIIKELKEKGFVFRHDTIVHSYPFCYRSGCPLFYRAVPSWFLKMEEFRELFLKINDNIHWMPHHIKNGRFGKWLENVRDWNIARSRYWGNPLPVWKNSTTGETLCMGSIKELERYTSHKVTDLHIDYIDSIKISCPKGHGTFKRVPFVLDCWFESGSMPYAQAHFPFEKEDDFESLFPADFICEGLDQTRGWFYTLTALAAHLFKKPAFKNVVVNGLVLAEDGKKMSKSLKNYPDPMKTLDEFGADSVRLFLLSSQATLGEEVRFSVDGVKDTTRRMLLPFWNAYTFFATYASLDSWDSKKDLELSQEPLDHWIMLMVNRLLKRVDISMKNYDISSVFPEILDFVENLNNWYIRRNRKRFWNSDFKAYSTLYSVLVRSVKVLAPFAPFFSEYLFCLLCSENGLQDSGISVHLQDLDEAKDISNKDEELMREVHVVRQVVDLGRSIRVQNKIKNRQPLGLMTIGLLNPDDEKYILKLSSVIKEELNVKNLKISFEPESMAEIFVKPNFKSLGKKLGSQIKTLQENLKSLHDKDRVSALRGLKLNVAGHEMSSLDYIVELRPSHRDELISTSKSYVVALDGKVTEELEMEGNARELVSYIQKARKNAMFNVEDRVSLFLECSDEKFLNMVKVFKNYIQEETLSEIIIESVNSDFYSEDVTINKFKVKIYLKKN